MIFRWSQLQIQIHIESYRADAYNGNGILISQPSESNLAHLPRLFFSKLLDTFDDSDICYPMGLLHSHASIPLSANCLGANRTCEMSIHEWHVSKDSDSLVMTVGEQFPFLPSRFCIRRGGICAVKEVIRTSAWYNRECSIWMQEKVVHPLHSAILFISMNCQAWTLGVPRYWAFPESTMSCRAHIVSVKGIWRSTIWIIKMST